jgi:hypothetical protein
MFLVVTVSRIGILKFISKLLICDCNRLSNYFPANCLIIDV